MRTILLLIIGFPFSVDVFSQEQRYVPEWSDTTKHLVELNPAFHPGKVIRLEVGKRSVIFLDLQSVRDSLALASSDSWNEAKAQPLAVWLDSMRVLADTILMADTIFQPDFFYLVADQLLAGNACVYDKRKGDFVLYIRHRLERSGSQAARFFYLPDGRPFYFDLEIMGIRDREGNTDAMSGYVEEYKSLFDKIRSTKEQ